MSTGDAFLPFDLDSDTDYRRWRAWKLDTAPRRVEDLIVEVGNLNAITKAEHAALVDRCRRANMAIYQTKASRGLENKQIPIRLGSQFGLYGPDNNWLADEDSISSITPAEAGERQAYIPYTERAIRWHTDGYYGTADMPIRAMALHCVRPAESGGETAVMDHELAYILLRDENPDFVRALSRSDAMSIPPRHDAAGEARAISVGPVFSRDTQTGDLNMRYTARQRNVIWRADAQTDAAVARLWALLSDSSRCEPWIFRFRLSAGMGVLCNNVLHDRAAFSDANHAARRLLYRARYHARIADTKQSYLCAATG